MNLFLFSISLVFYYAIHSILAANDTKAFFYKNYLTKKYYRLVFNLISVIGFALILYSYFLFEKHWFFENEWSLWGGGLIIGIGFYWIFQSLKVYDLGEFSGLDQLSDSMIESHTALKTNGLNNLVRHPLYFGINLIAWGVFLLFPNDAILAATFITSLYIFIGATLEERKLEQHFLDEYRSYQSKVPMLFPFGKKGL